MIAQRTIDRVFDAVDIVEIISQFVDLKKSGASYKGKSPFTEEKTPSFFVVPSKGIFKCFSSGKGGGVIKFLQENGSMSFPEAIEYLAKYYAIEMEYVEQTKEQQQAREKRTELKSYNLAASVQYFNAAKTLAEGHIARNQLDRFSKDSILQWQIGWADPSGKWLYDKIREKGLVDPAEKVGLLVNRQGTYYDTFRSKILFPIHDLNGDVVGFGGRKVEQTEDKKNPKFINTRETPIYDKSRILYGLYYARKAISSTGIAYLTEGYADVIGLHEIDLTNTIATCGTALTDSQVLQLKKIGASTIVLLRDGDAAGIKAARRDLEMILPHNINTKLVTLPDGKDPYDLSHDLEIEDPVQWIEDNSEDALIYFATQIYKNVGEDPHKQLVAIGEIVRLLDLIPSQFLKTKYRTQIQKATNIKISDLKEAAETLPSKEKANSYNVQVNNYDLPEGVDADEAYRHGFYPYLDEGTKDTNVNKTGYYFLSEGNWKVTNFVMTPIFHKYDMDENTRIIRIQDGILEPKILELPSDAFLSVDKFRNFLFQKGPYQFLGSKKHLDKLITKFLYDFPVAYELKTLGWQREGFFAFYNCIYNGKLTDYDDAGLVKHDTRFYFSPAASDIYSDFRKDDDLFENDRFLSYEESPITFEKWMDLMVKVYNDHAYAGIPFALLSIFRDLVFKVDNNCPFLYCYGQSKSGKSKFAESILNLFFNEMPAFNLNSGTDFAFANRLERFRNVPVFFNEFDDNVVRDEWFQSLKGAYDGEGRERGKGGSKRKTEIQKVNCTLVLVGQYMSTKDDNSILSRSIMRPFKLVQDRDDDQVTAYNELKELEKKGLTSIVTNILAHREFVEKLYYPQFNVIFKEIVKKIRMMKQSYEERVVRNYAALSTMVFIFQDKFKFPWTYQEHFDWCIEEIINMSALISETDILVDFWHVLASLAIRQFDVAYDVHYKIMTKDSVRISHKKESKTISLGEDKKVLYIRLRDVHNQYKMHKRKTGENPIDWTSLQTYLKNREYYLGMVLNERIGKHVVTAYLFDYDALGVNLEKESEEPFIPPQSEIPSPTQKNTEEELPF